MPQRLKYKNRIPKDNSLLSQINSEFNYATIYLESLAIVFIGFVCGIILIW